MSSRPKGSGWFAAAFGLVFLAVFCVSLRVDLRTIDVYRLFQAWLLFGTVMLLGWGINRINKGTEKDYRVGQQTINFVVGMMGGAFAILALNK